MNLRKRALRHLGAVAAVCMLVSACSPGSTPPPAAPPGTPAAPSTVAATPRETQLERQQRLDFEAAEKSYRAFRAEYTRLAQAGGVKRPSRVMKVYASGPYLDVMTDFLSQAKEAKKMQRGVVRIAYVEPGPYTTDKVILESCEDGRRVTNINSNGRVVSTGVAVRLELEVHRIDNKWKLWDGNDRKVSSCAR